MDRNYDSIAGLQRKADEFLLGLLPVSGGVAGDVARQVTNLAFQDGNPVRELFLAVAACCESSPLPPSSDAPAPPPPPTPLAAGTRRADVRVASEPARPPSPAETVRPRSSPRGLLWLNRGRCDGPEDRPAAPTSGQIGSPQHVLSGSGVLSYPNGHMDPTSSQAQSAASSQSSLPRPGTSGGGSSKSSSLDFSGKSMRSYFSSSQKANKAPGAAPYNCILCNCDLSSKGVCKRHLEDQHVVLKTYECEKCRQAFENKSEAKKHCGTCGAGVFYFITVKPEAKKLYACEFTGQRFQSLKTYIDHLVKLCEKRENRPQRSTHRKIRALLDHPGLSQAIREISSVLYGSPEAWKSLRWPDSTLFKTIRQLEFATINDNTTIELSGHSGRKEPQDIRVYLNELLRSGEMMQQGGPTSAGRSVDQSTLGSSISSRAPSRSSVSTSMADATGTPLTIPTPTSQSSTHLHHFDRSDTQSMAASVRSAPIFDSAAGIVRYEQKAKRPLSEQSRFFVPDRQPPGPPVPNDDVQYSMDTGAQQYSEQPHMPEVHTMSLPYRQQDNMGSHFGSAAPTSAPMQSNFADTEMHNNRMSDAGSDTTLAHSYQEPELISQMPFEGYWNHGQVSMDSQPVQFTFANNAHNMYDFSPHHHHHNYFTPDDSSIQTPSISSVQTFTTNAMVDQKLAAFDLQPNGLPHGGGIGSFFLEDDHGGHRHPV